MPARAPTPCRKPGCGALCRDGSGWCAAHKGEGWTRHQAGRTTTARGYGAQWRKLRAMVMHRDRAMCQACYRAGRHQVASEVDHVIPKAHGGTDALDNLEALCRRCHAAKTATEGRAGSKSGVAGG